tara:strand:- start:9 stop:665 length:657 start_codon:yes stop_codon:yes gene_type:complete
MSDYIKFLPSYLIKRYKNWKLTGYKKNRLWFNKIAIDGQNPSTMIISCCDSRIHVTSIFGEDKGEFFIHRNIANLVPPYNPDGDHHGTSAAVEYAVKILKVSQIIILGHSKCGGINSGYFLYKKGNSSKKNIFIDKWLNILNPSVKKILSNNKSTSIAEEIQELEKESIKTSLQNLNNFPFIAKAITNKKLILYGLWHDIGSGNLECLDPISYNFIKL